MGHTPFTIWLTGYIFGVWSVSLAFWLIRQCDRRRNLHNKHTNQPTNSKEQR